MGAVIIISPKRAEILKDQGYSKQAIADYLETHATKPLVNCAPRIISAIRRIPLTNRTVPSIVFKPGTIDVVVAGGNASPMMQAWHMYGPVTVSIYRWR